MDDKSFYKFRDLANNTIHCRIEDIKVIAMKSPLAIPNPQIPTELQGNTVFMTGCNAQVSDIVAKNILKVLGISTLIEA